MFVLTSSRSKILLTSALVVFVLAVFLTSSVSGLSKLVHVGMISIILALFARAKVDGLTIRQEPLLLIIWLFFTFSAFSVFWAVDQRLAIVSVASLFFDLLGATLILLALWNGAPFKALGYSAALGAVIQASFALQQFYAGAAVRSEGLANNSNGLATQLSLAAFLLLFTLAKPIWSRLLAFALVLIATLVSGSRKMVFIWLTFSLLIIQYLGFRFRRSAIFASIFLILAPLGVLGIMMNVDILLQPVQGLYVYERFEQTIEGNEASANIRAEMAQQGIDLWQQSPIWGYGINQFRRVSSFNGYSHNNFTELLTSFGVVGFSLYYSLLLIILLRGIRGIYMRYPQAWLVVGTVIMLIMSDVAIVAYSDRVVWLFLAALGHLSANLRSDYAEERRPASKTAVAYPVGYST